MKKQLYSWAALGAIIAVGFVAYFNSLNTGFQFDAEQFIINNFSIRTMDLKRIWVVNSPSRFIPYLTYAINYQLNQLSVFGYHFFNLVIHLITAVLVWWMTRLAFYGPQLKDSKLAQHKDAVAVLAGLLFVSHPATTESVTYIYQRSSSLATMFYVAAISFYIKARLIHWQKPQSKAKFLCFSVALLSAGLGVFTKQTILSLPAMVFLFEVCFMKPARKTLIRCAVIFFLIILLVPLGHALSSSAKNPIEFWQMRETDMGISTKDYLLTQFGVIVMYMRIALLPVSLNADYDVATVRSILDPVVLPSLITLVLVVLLSLRLFKKNRLAAYGVWWFLVTLLPESSIIPIRDVIFEHRLYLPLVGFCMFVAGGVYYLCALCAQKRRKFAIALLTLLVVVYSFMTYQRNKDWVSAYTLWDDTIKKSPKKARPYNNRGFAYYHSGRLKEAEVDFTKALELDPTYVQAWSNRGYTNYGLGNYEQGVYDCTRAVELSPLFAEAFNNRGVIYSAMGKYDLALADYLKTISLDDDYVLAYNNIGGIYANRGQNDQAIEYFKKAVNIDVRYAEAYGNLGIMYFNMNDFPQAIEYFTRALALKPNLAGTYLNRALAYFKLGEIDRSRQDVIRAQNLGVKVDENILKQLNMQ